MSDDSSMNTPATTEDIARVTLTASVRYRMIEDLITQLRAVNPHIAPHLAEATMLDAADELEQLIGGKDER